MSHAQPGARAPARVGGAPHGTPQPIAPGVIVGERYRVLDELGFGGMGAVFLVEHVHIERRAAMKVLRVERWSEELVRRFHREARAAARVVSERVATVTDFGMDPKFGPFYVMDLLVGETLEQRIERDGSVPEDELIHIAIGIAESLIDVHAEGIVHRDVKPSNVGISSGSVPVKLLDFGLAAATEEAAFLERITRSNEIIGSVAYMSPEQLQGFRPTFAVDLYSFGVTLYEAATGRLPFSGTSPGVIIAQHLSAAPPPLGLSTAGAPLSIELDSLTRQLMAKDPARRLPSALALRDALVTIQRRGRNSYPQSRPSIVVETRAAEPVKSSPPSAQGASAPGAHGQVAPRQFISSGVRAVAPADPASAQRTSFDPIAPAAGHHARGISPYGPTIGIDSSPGMPLLPTSLVPASLPPTITTRAVAGAPNHAPDPHSRGGSAPPSAPIAHHAAGPWSDARPSAPGHWPASSTERVMAPTMAAMPHYSAVAPPASRASSSGLLFAMVGLGAGMVLATFVVLGVLIATSNRGNRATTTLPPPSAIAPPMLPPSVLQPDRAAAVPPPAPPVEARVPEPPIPVSVPAPAPEPAMPGTMLPHPEPVDAGISTRVRAQRPGGARVRPQRPEYSDEPPVERPTRPPAPPPTRRNPGPWTGDVIDDPR